MKLGTKAAAVALCGATLLGSAAVLAGCGNNSGSGDWVLKTDNATINSGVYRYCLMYAYQNAAYMVEDPSKPILSQEIEGKPAGEWIQEEALTQMIPFLVAEDEMHALDLTLNDNQRYNAEQMAAQQWQSYKTFMEEYGIEQADLQYVSYDYSTKYSEIFGALYGEGGEKEVAREDMEAYFLEHFTDVSYLVAPTTTDNGATMTDDEKKALKEELDGYAKEVNDGKKTMEQVGVEYDTSKGITEAQIEEGTAVASMQTVVQDLSDESYGYPEKFVSAVEKAEPGKATVLDLSDEGYYVLYEKHDIQDAEASFFSEENQEQYEENMFSILISMKQAEYVAYMEQLAKDYDRDQIQFNEEQFNLDLVAMFGESVEEETASEVASETVEELESQAN